MFGEIFFTIPDIRALSTNSIHALATRCTVQLMVFPFVNDWVTLNFFSFTASRKTVNGKCLEPQTMPLCASTWKAGQYNDAGLLTQAARIFTCWQSSVEQTCREPESENSLQFDCPSSYRCGMPRKLALPDKFAPFPAAAANYLHCAETCTAPNPYCSMQLSTTSTGRTSRQGVRQRTSPLDNPFYREGTTTKTFCKLFHLKIWKKIMKAPYWCCCQP